MTERFAAEVLGILVGSIGLVLAMPLTTAVGVAVVRASGAGQRPVRTPSTARTVDTARSQRPAAAKQPSPPKEPARPQPKTAASPEPATVELPQANRRQQPAASNGKPAASESQPKRRRYRRDDDDFGDFTYLHDPEETDPRSNPGIPRSRGRRAR